MKYIEFAVDEIMVLMLSITTQHNIPIQSSLSAIVVGSTPSNSLLSAPQSDRHL